MDIPLEVLTHANIEQLPTITAQSPGAVIALPSEESFAVMCEAKGNPEPEFRWTKNGQEFDPSLDPLLRKEENSGTFVIPNNGNLTEYQGTYRCFAFNKLGTAVSQEIGFMVPKIPKFPKEGFDPFEVEEGQPFILKCDPPKGIPPLQIYWMTMYLQHIEQDDRVSMGLNGDLYFSHVEEKDSRRDYCCFAAFPKIRTIVQKSAMSVVVTTTNSILQRKPSLLTPPGVRSEAVLVKGEDLRLECIAEGIPTPKVEWEKMGHGRPEKFRLENHGKVLVVPGDEQDVGGKYLCKAKNPLGEVVHYFTVTVEEPPEFLVEPQSQLSMIGADVVIKCSVSGSPQPITTWSVNGVPLQETLSANRKIFDDTIIIQNGQPSDSAVYQCEASNKHGKILTNANIMIMNLYPIILTSDGQEYSAVEDQGVMMHCKVFSSPPSTIFWSKDDSSELVTGPRFTVHDNGSLEIHTIEKGDTGQYTCLAKNLEGTSAVDAMLYVKGTFFGRHDNSTYSCVWQVYQWRLIVSVSRYFLEEGVLHIVNVSHRDQGEYRCVARTPVDSDVASARLIVLGEFTLGFNLLPRPKGWQSVKLRWIPGEDHNSSITEFVIEFEENKWQPGSWRDLQRVPGNHNSAVLDLHGHVGYRFRVYAVNAVGAGPPSKPTERYLTPPAAPDKNPENIKIEGHLPHEMDINWEPLSPIEHNGPGLEYKVSYRRQDVEDEWKEHTVKRHSFVVRNTPTFVPYEIKIQAKNHQGWGPEPKMVTGYSGEDCEFFVSVMLMNSSVVKVTWKQVPKDKLHGHLGGYRVNWWRMRSLLHSKQSQGERHTAAFPGSRSHGTVSGLVPFSEYSLIVMSFNGRGNGPGSKAVNFKTPEGGGFPELVADVQKRSISLAWTPPLEPNGILTGYLLEYQLSMYPYAGPLQTVNISKPDTTRWHLRDLEPLSKYRFQLRSCTSTGCGSIVNLESTTLETSDVRAAFGRLYRCKHLIRCRDEKAKASQSHRASLSTGLASVHTGISSQGWFIGLMSAIALLTLVVLIACFVNRNKGGKYSVKEKEDLHPDVESQGINDDTFCEYSDNDEKPLKGSQHSLSGGLKAEDSGDSLVDYGDDDAQFNEDGSFIGEYAAKKEKRASAEIKATAQTPA
uniref:Cell adhesion molecule L1-like b n=1 Tax=Oryzias sinensis TaxID=183150 RepID=A0A8C7ZCS0_9TELE